MISVKWRVFTDADCDSFNVYRSIPGVVIDFPNLLAPGDVLKFSVNASDVQEITFTAADIDTILATFNAVAKGAVATKSADNTKLFIRVKGSNPKLKLYPSSFLSHTNQSPRIIVPKLEWNLIGSVALDSPTLDYSYDDADGTEFDFYRITSVKEGIESLPTVIQKAQLSTDDLCFVEGRIVNAQNRPIVGMTIKTRLAVPESEKSSAVSLGADILSYKTDEFGRFLMILPRFQQYRVDIEALGYSWVVDVPDLPFVGLNQLIITKKHLFAPLGDSK